jgi:MoaA/NifB/PqqE/SkfB family radical SAM enzyme
MKKCSEIKYYTPQIVGVMLINRCNLQCNYCGLVIDGVLKAPKEEITLEIIKKAFVHKLLKNALLVDLLGGEPLLCNDLIPIVKFLSSRGFLTNTSTNGILLLDKIEELKKAGITRINVSIYPDNFDKLKTTIEQINKIFPVHTSFVLTKTILENNLNFIFNVIDLSVKSGCKSLRFWMYRQQGKKSDSSEIIMDNSPAYKEFKEHVEEKYKRFILFPQVVHRTQAQEKKCTQLWQRTNLNFDGSIGICCGSSDLFQDINLFQNNFNEIYNCKQVIDMRKNLLDNSVLPLEMCKKCNLLTESGW